MNIYVGNLSAAVTEQELRQEFTLFGEVSFVALMNDGGIGSGQRRGCAYVEMPVVREGELAIEQLQGTFLKGSKLDVIKSLPVTHNVNSKVSETPLSGFDRKTRYWGDRRHKA